MKNKTIAVNTDFFYTDGHRINNFFKATAVSNGYTETSTKLPLMYTLMHTEKPATNSFIFDDVYFYFIPCTSLHTKSS